VERFSLGAVLELWDAIFREVGGGSLALPQPPPRPEAQAPVDPG